MKKENMNVSDRVLFFLQRNPQKFYTEYELHESVLQAGYPRARANDFIATLRTTPNIGYVYDKGYCWNNLSVKELEDNRRAIALFDAL